MPKQHEIDLNLIIFIIYFKRLNSPIKMYVVEKILAKRRTEKRYFTFS